jgi:hypothetical protein
MLGDDIPAVRLGDLADDCKAEARAGHPASGASSIETIEDVREILVGDPRAVISHYELSVVYLHLDLRARRAPLRRVVEKIPDGSLDRGRNALHRRRLELDRVRDLRPVSASALDDIRDEEVKPYILWLTCVLLGSCELDEL